MTVAIIVCERLALKNKKVKMKWIWVAYTTKHSLRKMKNWGTLVVLTRQIIAISACYYLELCIAITTQCECNSVLQYNQHVPMYYDMYVYENRLSLIPTIQYYHSF